MENLDARIICTNVDNRNYPIVALIYYDNGEFPGIFSINGEFNIGCQNEDNDLFLVKYEFEYGDIIAVNLEGNKFIIAFERYSIDNGNIMYSALFDVKNKTLDYMNCCLKYYSENNIRLATEEEKQKLFAALTKEGKQWNAETKQIEDVKKEYEFKPFDRVLVRDRKGDLWANSFFGNYSKSPEYRYKCMGSVYRECIPFEGNEELLGTTNDCSYKYKNR